MTTVNDSSTSTRSTGRKARTDVARALILAAVASLVLIGSFNFYQGRKFLVGEVEAQLQDVGGAKAARIERGIADLSKVAEALAASPTMTEALVEFSAAFGATDEQLTSAQEQELATFYDESLADLDLVDGSSFSVSDLYPTSSRTQYLQYWYIASNPYEDRAELVDAGDGSLYSQVHATYHPAIQQLNSGGVASDVALLDVNGDVVYTFEKRIDLARSLASLSLSGESISEAITKLQASPAGEAVLVDFASYVSAGGAIEMWIITLVRDGDEVVGALAVSIPNSVLTDLVTSHGMWEETGLGETGEVYLVGEDGFLRTESRLFLEDPDAYLAEAADVGFGPEVTEKAARFGTTVLIQPVDTEPVSVAQEGDQFSGGASSYLAKRSLAVSSPIEPSSLRWVVVTEIQQSEVFAPLYSYLRRLVVAGVVVSILVVILALAAARWLLRPIDPIVEAASRVGDGDLSVELPDAGRDEFAYLSGQLNLFVEELARRAAEVRATEAETSELLASVVPRRLVERVMAGNRDIAETMSNASLIAFTVKGSTDNLGNLEFLAEQNVEVMSGLASIADQHGAEQLSSSAVTLLYATGLGVDEPRIEDAVEFGIRASSWLTDLLSEQGYMLGVSVGIASGDMVAGVMGTERLTVDVIGAPRQIAGSLSQAADQRQVLVDAEVASRLGESWAVERVSDLEDVGGSPIDAWTVTKRISV